MKCTCNHYLRTRLANQESKPEAAGREQLRVLIERLPTLPSHLPDHGRLVVERLLGGVPPTPAVDRQRDDLPAEIDRVNRVNACHHRRRHQRIA